MQQRSGLRAMDMKNQENVPSRPSKIRRFLPLVFCLGSLYQYSCTPLWPDLAVSVVIPDLPPAWSEANGWELDWRSISMVGPARTASPGDTLILFLPRTGMAAVRCRPVFGFSRGDPYGAVWPQDAGAGGVMEMGPGGGLAAELAFRLFQGGWNAPGFNLRRFAMEAELRMADPWDSDFSILATAVTEGRFRADYLRTPVHTPVQVSGLPGEMASGSPWGETVRPDAQGHAMLSSAPGIYRWFGCAQELVVAVSSDGSAEWILRGTDGRMMEKVLP